jgi:hypothetical protein
VGNNKSTTTKNAGKSLAISIAMHGGTTWGALPNGAHPGLHSKPLDTTIEQVPEPYHSGGRHNQKNC